MKIVVLRIVICLEVFIFLFFLKAGRKWDTVEEVERITRRASSEERSDIIKAVQRPQVNIQILSIVNYYEQFRLVIATAISKLLDDSKTPDANLMSIGIIEWKLKCLKLD